MNKTSWKLTGLLALWLSGVQVHAQTPGTTVIHAGTLYDGSGAGALHNVSVVIQGDTITQIAPSDTITVAAGTREIDRRNSTVMPGFFDTHGHLRYRYTGGGAAGRHAQATGGHGYLAMRMVKNARTQLLSGITSMRMTGEVGFLDFDIRDAINSGMIPGPRIIPSGRLITTAGGHGGYEQASQADGPWELVRLVRENFNRGARVIKFSMVDTSPTGAQMTLEELSAGVQAAHDAGIPATIHCTGNWGSCIRIAIDAGVDSIEHARPLSLEIIDLLARNDIALSLTPLVYIGFRPSERWWHYLDHEASSAREWVEFLRNEMISWREQHPQWELQDRPYEDNESNRASRDFFPAVKKRQQQVLQAYEAGIPIGLGLDTLYGGITVTMEWMVEAGIPLPAVVHMATGGAAQIAGVADKVGTIEAGKLADIIAVEGSPEDDISALHAINLVIKDGQRVDDRLSWN